MSSEKRKPCSALSNARRNVEPDVQIVSLLPHLLGCVGRAGFVLEHGETTNGVGEVERPNMFLAAVDRQRFDVTRLGQRRTTRLIVRIAEVANSVCQFHSVVAAPRAGDSEFGCEYVCPIADAGHGRLPQMMDAAN